MKIYVKQIDSASLSSFVLNTVSGGNFSGILGQYISSSGFYGNHVAYTTGGIQNVFTQFNFNVEQLAQTGTNPSGVTTKQYVDSNISGSIQALSGSFTGSFARKNAANTFTAINTFNSNIFVPRATNTGHAVNRLDLLDVSGILRTGINNVQVADTVYTSGFQRISGQKHFTTNPLATNPTQGSGVVTVDYLTGNFSIFNTVNVTGDQNISGVKTFLTSPVVPIATSSTQAIRKSQLDAGLAAVSIGTGAIQGVSSVNGISGAVFIEGSNGISVCNCDNIIYVSGNASSTQLFSISIPLTSGITGISVSYGSGFNSKPNVIGNLELVSQSGSFSPVSHTIIDSTSGGFNVGFSTGIPSSGYYFNSYSIPFVSGGSGFFGLKGERGNAATNLSYKGRWQAGLLYNQYDLVFTQPNNVTYLALTGAVSTSANSPSGTGNLGIWGIFASGMVGPTGFYIYKGVFDTGVSYGYKDSVTYDGSTYVYTGTSPSSGFTPEALTGNWGLVAAKAPLGYFINSGVITGNFTTVSFFLSPASTGLNLAESFISQDFFFTGFALAATVTGAGPENGGILTGSIYTSDLNNNKIQRQSFTFDSGLNSFVSGDFSVPLTGYHRIGVDITNTLSGLDKLSIGVFGFGT